VGTSADVQDEQRLIILFQRDALQKDSCFGDNVVGAAREVTGSCLLLHVNAIR